MVKVTDKALIIEIPTMNEAPLEKLAYMQTGLLELIALVDHEEPKQEIQNGLWHLRTLLKEMMLTPQQLLKITEAASNDPSLMESFN